MEMEFRTEQRQRAVRRRRAQRSRPSERERDGGEDRLSALPDELLLLVLGGLGSTAEAARTSVLSPRFDTLWPDLHVLVFRGVYPDTLDRLLARARHGALARLEMQLRGPRIPASRVSSLLRAAEDHKPQELVFSVGGGGDDGDVPFELPYFTRAETMDLQTSNRRFALPPGGGCFVKLERLTLTRCRVAPADFLPRCPCLRVLDMECYWTEHAVKLSSGSLEKLVLRDVPLPVPDATPRRVDITASSLKEFMLQTYGLAEMMTSFSAPPPMVETLSFRYLSRLSRAIGIANSSRLQSLTTEMEWHTREGEIIPIRVRVLSMVILSNDIDVDADRTFVEEIARLPVNNFSVLKLDLRTMSHDFGTLVFDLLKKLNDIQKLELVLLIPLNPEIWTPTRYLDYDPDEWRNEDISLPHLEEIKIEGLNLTDHDIDFLEDLFASAPQLKTVRINLSPWVSQSDDLGYKDDLRGLFWKNPSVKFYVDDTLEGALRRSTRLRVKHQCTIIMSSP